eukprot:m.130557 g.130557  ORF g.130557 m.130557 type:complete len:82 (-) comp14778_c1_seq2:811-1056(-)
MVSFLLSKVHFILPFIVPFPPSLNFSFPLVAVTTSAARLQPPPLCEDTILISIVTLLPPLVIIMFKRKPHLICSCKLPSGG